MRLESALKMIEVIPKGAFVKVTWHRDCAVRKRNPANVTKRTEAVCRLGINYDNIAKVQDARANGDLPEEPQSIWNGKGQWTHFPFILIHTVSGEPYLRLYNTIHGGKVTYFEDHQETTKDAVKEHLLAYELKNDRTAGTCFCCQLKDIISVEWKNHRFQ
jgi:hypothetical protein